MYGKKYLIGIMVLALLLAVPATAVAEYSDVVTDPAGDVMRYVDDGVYKHVENPNIDIRKVEISEDNGDVTVSLTVEGSITDDPDIYYEIMMTDGGEGEFEVKYNNGECTITAYLPYDGGVFGNQDVPHNITGVGTSTMNIEFRRDHIGSPDALQIFVVSALNEGVFEVDLAGPGGIPEGELVEDDDPVDDGDDAPDNGDDAPDNGEDAPEDEETTEYEDDDSPGFAFLALAVSITLAVLFYKKKQ